MALKKFNPTTPSQRNLVLVDKSALYKGGPVKKLTEGLSKTGGRNNSGHVTAWQKGGGHKRRYRLIDVKRTKTGIFATVERIEYDPNRTALSRSSLMKMVNKAIFWHHSVCRLVTRFALALALTSSRATLCHWLIFLLER